ncbi:FtsJ-like methyltransferase-domain-containing protein [Apiospora arundinis]|uniref:rRNA methyltransferase 2, mitochondrial n=1 Tax=Apiospora arundinis TaxID=335852 RepID=A0ABR2J9Y5_9PEZI
MGRKQEAETDPDMRLEILHELEMRHQSNASSSDLLVKDEDVRRLKLRILMLRDENNSLRDQIAQNTDAGTKLAAKCDDLSAQLRAKIEVVRLQEKQLRKQEREFSQLQAELQMMNNLAQDSNTVLAEKLSLTRELAVLKPELDHLRSQIAHQQETLAEKLALERQVNTLEVELANEKKATKRAMQKRESNDRVEDDLRKKLRETEKSLATEKAQRERLEDQLAQEKHTHDLALQDQDSTREVESDLRKKLQDAQREVREAKEEKERLEEELQAEKRRSKKAQSKASDNAAEADLRAQLEDVENRLAAEQKQKEKIRQQSQDALTETEARNDALEKKLEKMKTKTRDIQAELKQCQSELRKAQKAKPTLSEEIAAKTAGRQAFKKRKVHDIGADEISQISIATPNADERPRKGPKKRFVPEPSMVGEKSTFSITPFLNRGKTAMDSALEEEDELGDTSIIPQQFANNPGAHIASVLTSDGDDDAHSLPEENETAPAEAEKPQTEAKSRGRPKKALADAPSARKNSQVRPKTALKKTTKVAKLAQVAEEGEASGGQESAVDTAAEKTQAVKFNDAVPEDTSTESANAPKGEEVKTKKKKRKVLGSTKTLFDEDGEEEAPVPAPKAQLKGALKTRTKGPLGGVPSSQAVLRKTASQPLIACCSTRWSSSNSRWKQRQGADFYAQKAKVEGLKSRAAFKLLEMDSKYRLFRRGQTVVDLGYAPGSWSQPWKVAHDRTKPHGRVVGIDLIPAQPPKGVSTIQGNFLAPAVQSLVKDYLVEFASHRAPMRPSAAEADKSEVDSGDVADLIREKPSYIDTERAETNWPIHHDPYAEDPEEEGRLVDVVLSDMSAPWRQLTGFGSNTLSNPYDYDRMMNTSGMSFRDHAGSMDLCLAALQFASDTLRSGGHFVCKFYAGSEDRELEQKLKKMFGRVFREKPDSSRSESKEAYFVALRRKGYVTLAECE